MTTLFCNANLGLCISHSCWISLFQIYILGLGADGPDAWSACPGCLVSFGDLFLRCAPCPAGLLLAALLLP